MKRIGIDARLYFQTGVGVYIRNFLHYLQKNPPKEFEFFIYVLEKDSDQIRFVSPQFTKVTVNSHWHSLSEQFNFVQILNKDNLDLMHFTYFSYPVLYRKKFIATIHDVTPLLHKTGRASTLNPLFYELKYRSLTFVLQQQVQNASVIITPTETVKDELVKVYGSKYKNKIQPIYEGVNYEMQEVNENTALAKIYKNPFFIYIGNFYPHKNVETLLKAFSSLQTDTELVLVGPDNYFASRLQNELNPQDLKRIRFHHTGSNSDLVFFYKNAQALINPSISEGFGLPLVEAAYFKTPVIASNLQVFHEILGDSFTSFNPHSVGELEQILTDVVTRKRKLLPPKLDAAFSFEHLTKKIVTIYKKKLS